MIKPLRSATRRAVWPAVSVLVAVTAFLSGCDGPAPTKEPDLGEVPVITSPVDLALPLDQYFFPMLEEYEVFLEATSILVAQCFERFDLPHPGAGYELSPLAAVLRGNRSRYGLVDAASAAARGYNSPYATSPSGDEYDFGPSAPEPSGSQELAEFIASGHSDPRFGDRPLPVDKTGHPLPPDGCSGEAARQVIGTSELADPDLPSRLATESLHQAEADSRLVAAMARWSDCMARSGYDYATSWEPNDRGWPDPATDEEIATATTDVGCKVETNLVGIWYAVDRAYQQSAVDAHAEQLNVIETYIDTVVRRSADVIAGRSQ